MGLIRYIKNFELASIQYPQLLTSAEHHSRWSLHFKSIFYYLSYITICIFVSKPDRILARHAAAFVLFSCSRIDAA